MKEPTPQTKAPEVAPTIAVSLPKADSSSRPATDSILRLQRAMGNQSVQRLIQPKLPANQPGVTYEQHADRLSDEVMRMPEPQAQPVQASDTSETEAPPVVHEVLRSPDQPLDPVARFCLEPHLGYDFARVRVHTDGRAAESANAVGAAAYTVGHDIVFNAGRYAPQTAEGKRLLAHELAHVVQQRFGPADGTAVPGDIRLGDPSDQFEREASVLANRVVREDTMGP